MKKPYLLRHFSYLSITSLLLVSLLLSNISALAQVTLYSESFETNGEGVRYFSNTYVDCPNSNFFFRTNTNPVTPPTCTQFFSSTLTNLQGSYFWASEDIRANELAPNLRPPGSLSTTAINIAGYNTLQVSLYLATSGNNGTRWETDDSLNIQVSVDGRAFTAVGRFMGGATFGGHLIIDSNLNGVIDGPESTTCDQVNFTKYTFSIPFTGSTLEVNLDFDQVGGSEELAIDLIEVTGAAAPGPSAPNPVVASSTSICAGQGVLLSATCTTGTVTWYTQTTGGTAIGTGSPLSQSPTTSVTYYASCSDVTGESSRVATPQVVVSATVTPSVSISANPGTSINAGISVTFTATPTNGGSSPGYQWKKNNVNVGTGSVYTDAGLQNNDVITCVMTSNATCPLPSSATSSLTMTVAPAVITLVTSASPTTVCVGGSASLSVVASGGSAPYSYTWAAPPGITLSGVSSSAVSGTATSSGVKTLTITVAGSGGSPVSTSTVNISVNGNPTVSISSNPSLTICLGQATSLSASGAASYSWSSGESTTVISTSLGGTFSVTGTTAGCSAAASVTLIQRALPTATVTPMPGLTVCSGQSITLTASPGLSYTWSTGSNSASTFFVPTSNTIVSLTVNDGVCSSTAINTNVVSSATSVSITLSASATLTCSQTSLTLTASGGLSYVWDDNSTNATRVVSTSGLYSVTATGVASCTSTTSTTISSNTSAPPATISASPSAILSCTQTSITLTAGGGTSYLWDDNSINALRLITTAGTYSVVVTGANGCTASSTTVVSSQTALVNVSISASQTLICRNGLLTLDAFAAGGNSPYSYSWIASGGATLPSSATGATISATLVTAGLQTFTVTATEASGCRSTTTLSVSVVDGVGITAQPTGSSAICAGISVTVPVSVTGAVQGYQWYKGSTPVVSQTTATLTLPAVITNQSGVYVLIVQSSACSSVTSTSFSLVVSEVVAIVAQPVVSSVVCSGASITIPVSVTGSGASYQWYKGSTPISNQFSATLSLSALQTTDGGSYSLVITGGCNSVTSSAFSLTVNYSPILSISPSVTTIMGGQSTTLTVAGADSYTWSTPSNNSAIVVSPTATTIYSVTGTQNDCIGLATATVSVTCSALIVADAISVIAVGQLGPNNCTIMLTGTGYGTGYTITGPNGYVFSAVYRRVGNYQINGLAIKSPGTYTLTVSYSDACGRSSTDMLTYEVIGEACR